MQAVFKNSDRLEGQLVQLLCFLKIIGVDHLLKHIIFVIMREFVMPVQGKTPALAGIVRESYMGYHAAGFIRSDIALISLDAEVVWCTAVFCAYGINLEFSIVHNQYS